MVQISVEMSKDKILIDKNLKKQNPKVKCRTSAHFTHQGREETLKENLGSQLNLGITVIKLTK